MEMKSRANIVILASAHNPSIINPQWVKEHLITEEPLNFVNTPEFSLFESENYSLMVDRERMQITAKKTTSEILKSLSEIAIKYIELLSHIPYKSLGFNFGWFVDKNIPNIKIKLSSADDLSNIMKNHDLKYGFIVHAKSDNYLLKLITEPQGENMLTYNFNYHHEVDEKNEGIIEYLSSFMKLYKHSQEIVENTLVGGKK
jgi:hypothetical protein